MNLIGENTQDWISNVAAWKDEAEIVSIKSYLHLLFYPFISYHLLNDKSLALGLHL